MACDDFAIDEEPQFPVDVPPDPAQANFAFGNVAVASAGSASDSAVGKLLI